MVYGRAFNIDNIIEDLKSFNKDYSTIFFNKEGDIWKICEISVKYGEETKIIVERESRFKGSMEEGLKHLKEFGKDKKVFIDCSATQALSGIYAKQLFVERYEIEDFDKSVTQMNLAFSKKRALIYKKCVLTKSDIENFKFSKTKDDTVKYVTNKDGFVSCLRTALTYYGGII